MNSTTEDRLRTTLSISYLPTSILKPHERNPRTHTKKQIRQIAESIKTFGFTNPILLDENNGVIAGHGQLEAAKQLGITEVPTIRLSDMTQAQKRAYIIADNKLAENAGWDQNLLKLELEYITKLDIAFDLTVTELDIGEIDMILDRGTNLIADAIPETDPNIPPVNRQGDLWHLGDHRLLCADARDRSAYLKLLDGKKAQMVLTDPPYNVAINGNVCGRGQVRHQDFVMATGEMTEAPISPLRRRMIEDMTIRKFAPKTQQATSAPSRTSATFLGRSPDTASFEDVRRFQLHLASSGAGVADHQQHAFRRCGSSSG